MNEIIRVNQVSPAESIYCDVVPIPGKGEDCALYAAFERIYSTATRDEERAKELFKERYGYEPEKTTRGKTDIFCGPIRPITPEENGGKVVTCGGM